MPLTRRRLIDAHLHLDEGGSGSAMDAAESLNRTLIEAGVELGIVLHLESQRWPIEEVAEAVSSHSRLIGFANIHPFADNAERRLRHAKENLSFRGLKLHPRLQAFDIADARVETLVRAAGELDLPVMIDAFPDGDWLKRGFEPRAFAALADACPGTDIIIGHFGGHHCIDMMMLAKRTPNMYFDFSFSLLYYFMGGTLGNILYCCNSMRCERIFYGSDHPGVPAKDALEKSLAIFADNDFSDDQIDAIFFKNASEFLGWNDL